MGCRRDHSPGRENLLWYKAYLHQSRRFKLLRSAPRWLFPKENSQCPTSSVALGKLPDTGQQTTAWFSGDTWVANDCFLVAEASVAAGKYKGKDCTVSPTGAFDYMATCIITTNIMSVEDDWISGLALDFMSETMKNIVMLTLTQPWMHDKLDNYTTGILTLAYHAAWGSLMKRLGNESEPTTTRMAESVVRATVDCTRIRMWFVMSAMLTASAILVAAAQNVSITETVRDTTLAALAMDLTKMTHSDHSSGLCSTVALSKKNHNLARLKWTDNCDRGENHICRRRVVFADSDATTHGRPLY